MLIGLTPTFPFSCIDIFETVAIGLLAQLGFTKRLA